MDAGTTSAFAVLDFQGRLVHLSSRKHWQEKDFFQELSEYQPTVVASDTAKPSKLCSKVKSSFGAKLFHPVQSMTELEKSIMTREFRVHNKHERDALAAAIKAYNHFHNKLEQVARHARGRSDGAITHAQGLVLRGMRMSDAL